MFSSRWFRTSQRVSGRLNAHDELQAADSHEGERECVCVCVCVCESVDGDQLSLA